MRGYFHNYTLVPQESLKYVKLDRKALETIFITFIRPLLEYGDIVWDNCTQYEKQELEKVQIEAVRIPELQNSYPSTPFTQK